LTRHPTGEIGPRRRVRPAIAATIVPEFNGKGRCVPAKYVQVLTAPGTQVALICWHVVFHIQCAYVVFFPMSGRAP
jgi:hypothetical protein